MAQIADLLYDFAKDVIREQHSFLPYKTCKA
jgi:hypothetical protein